jgi:hypothetical protein
MQACMTDRVQIFNLIKLIDLTLFTYVRIIMLGFASSPHVRSGWWFSAGSVAACMFILSICADASLHDRQTYRHTVKIK